jgi:hypothetical protein
MGWNGRRAGKKRVYSWFVVCLMVVLCMCLFVPSAGAEANFQTSTVSGLTSAYHIVSADFNNDTIPDLAVTQWSTNQMTVLLGNGRGGFTTGATLATGVHPNFIDSGNLNGTGGIDLAVTNGSGDRDVTLFFNNGTGTSWSTTTLNIGSDADVSSLVAASLTSNTDTNIDLFIVKNSGVTTDFYEVWQGDGAGTFIENTGASGGTENEPLFVATADINGDTKPDMIISNYADNSLTVLLGNGDGTFSEATGSPINVGSQPRSISTGNLNGDAHVDLAVTNLGSNAITILLGNGDGTFDEGGSFQVSSQPASNAIADFDGDGFSDIAVSRWSVNTVSIYYGNGDGTFKSMPTSVTVGTNPFFLVAADFDKDGRTDLAVTNYGSNNVTILTNKICVTPLAYLVAWWSGDGHPFDLLAANNGAMMNGATYGAGKVGRAFSFDGVSAYPGKYVDLPDAASNLISDSAGTITAWVYPTAIGDNDIVVAFGSGSDGQGIGIGIYGNVRIYHHTGTYDWQSTTPVNANEWTMLTYTWNGSTETIYKNGVFSESRPRNFTYVPGHARIGHGFWGDSVNAFPGLIDEVAVYSQVLSAEEIAAIYNAGGAGMCKPCFETPSDMVSWWTGDGDATDIFGPNDVTPMNGATFVPGFVDQAFSLDGVDDLFRNVAPVNLPTGNAARSISVWFKTPRNLSTSTESAIVQYGTASDSQNFSLITSANAPGKLYFYGHSNDLPGTTTIQPDTWYHGVVTHDGSTLRLYMNGQLDASSPKTLNTVLDGNGLTIGYRNGSSLWEGLIDEVQVFDRALSAEEIAAIHGAGSSGVCIPPDTTPDQFIFNDQTNVALNSLIESNQITVAGIEAPADVSITGGEYSINGGAYTSLAGTVQNGQTVRVRQTSSTSYLTTTNATLTIGGVSDTFSVATIPIPTYAITGSVVGDNGTITCTTPIALGANGACTVVPLTGYHVATITDNGNNVLPSLVANRYVISNVTEAHAVVVTFAADVTATLNVCPSCSYQTTQEAVDAASSDLGSTTLIRLVQGTYNQRIIVDTSKKVIIQGGWNADFSARSNDPSLTVITTGPYGLVTARATAGEYIEATVDGLRLTGSGSNNYDIGGGAAAEASGGGTVVLNLENCLINNNGGSNAHGAGIGLLSHGAGSGVYFAMNNTKVIENNITFYNGAGMYIHAYDGGFISGVITNNLIANNSAMYGGGMYIQASESGTRGVVALSLINNTITNNTAWQYSYYGGGPGGGMLINGLLGDVTIGIENSIIWGNNATHADSRDIYLDRETGGSLVINASHSDIGYVYNEPTDTATVNLGSGMINADPLFVNATGQDYRLQTGSPAIDSANASVAPETDIMGNSRPLGAGVDMGVYEKVPEDLIPDQFTFTDQTGVALSTVIESNGITVTGINVSTAISITGGEYSINGGAYTSASGTVENGQTVRVRQTSSALYSTTTNATLTIGGMSDTFSVITIGPPEYTISFSSTGNGIIICNPATVLLGGSSACTITPGIGSLLVNLTDNGIDVMNGVSGNTYTLSNVTENHTVEAVFEHFTFTPDKGTLGTVIEMTGPGFGTKKGKVYLEKDGARYATKVSEWNLGGTSNLIKATVKKVPPAGSYRVILVSKEVGEVSADTTFEIMAPEVESAGVALVDEKRVVTIQGDYFGYTKKPKAYMNDGVKDLPCKVVSFTGTEIQCYPHKSVVSAMYTVKVIVGKILIGERVLNITMP